MHPRHAQMKAAIIAYMVGFSAALLLPDPSYASHFAPEANRATRLAFPMMNAEIGKRTFVEKGCIACHAVNGVGGHDAPAMDAHKKMEYVNPFDFAAKMWNHAPGMIAAQEEAFDEQVNLTGDDLANIIAFVHDDKAQHTFSEKDLTAKARKMMDHSHGGSAPVKAHAEEVGHGHGMPEKAHGHAPGTPKHAD